MSSHPADPCGPAKFLPPLRSIRLRTEIPGPKARTALQAMSLATGEHISPLIVSKAHGSLLYDVDGNILIDFSYGLHELGLGHTADWATQVRQANSERLAFSLPAVLSEDVFTLASVIERLAHEYLEMSPTATVRLFPSVAEAQHLLQNLDIVETGALHLETHLARTGTWFDRPVTQHPPVYTLIDLYHLAALVGPPMPISLPAWRHSAVSMLDCAWAVGALRLIEEQGLVERANQLGALVQEKGALWPQRFPMVEGIQGRGANLVLSLKQPLSTAAIQRAALDNGLVLANEVEASMTTSIPLSFPLVIPEEQLVEGLAALEMTLEELYTA